MESNSSMFRGTAADMKGIAPALFTAITGQLGLKLESGRAPAPVLVIQSIHRPAESSPHNSKRPSRIERS
jgi:uncharacterized protein (TIGR03435 family)